MAPTRVLDSDFLTFRQLSFLDSRSLREFHARPARRSRKFVRRRVNVLEYRKQGCQPANHKRKRLLASTRGANPVRRPEVLIAG